MCQRAGPVAVLPLAVRAAGAGVVAAALRVLRGVELDDLGRRTALGEQAAHEAGAQVVEPGVAVGGGDEAVLRAAAVAGEADVAVEAVLRERVPLVEPELALMGECDELDQRQLL